MNNVSPPAASPQGISEYPSNAYFVPKLEAVAGGALTPNLRMLKERYGFDTVAARHACVNLARLPSGSRVLDVGTSSGWMAIVLAAAAYRVVAVDIDRDALTRARLLATQFGAEVAERIEFVAADALGLPFEEDTFDGVFSFESLHHFTDCPRVVEEMYRVCRPGGVVTIADLNGDGLRAVRETMQSLTGQPHEENPCRLLALQQLLQRFGQVERQDIPFVGVFTVRKGVRTAV
jgi:ubiquinone/menaquinone biosynthesis C-methylase UbiE